MERCFAAAIIIGGISMDVYKEQNVVRAQTGHDRFAKVAVLIIGLIVAFAVFFLTAQFGVGGMGLLLAGGVLFGAYYITTGFDNEYEYLLTNGEMDFDKIIAQRSRKRLITVKLDKATEFAEFDESTEIDSGASVVSADDNTGENVWYLRVEHKDLGDTYILFNPNEEMRETMMKFFPHKLQAELRRQK